MFSKSEKTKEEFSEFIEPNKGIIGRVSRLFTNSEEDRLDLYQDILYQLWMCYPQFRGDSKPGTFIYKVAFNVACTRLRKEKRRKKMHEEYVLHTLNSKPNTSNGKDDIKRLYAAISKLNDVDKSIITLFLDEYSNDEIAEILGISQVNARVKIHRAKKQLRKILTNENK